MQDLWSVNSFAAISNRNWADEAVCYDAASGNTHFLDELAAEILAQLQRSSLTLEQLVLMLQDRFIFPPEEDVIARTESTLAELRGIGLIVTVS